MFSVKNYPEAYSQPEFHNSTVLTVLALVLVMTNGSLNLSNLTDDLGKTGKLRLFTFKNMKHGWNVDY